MVFIMFHLRLGDSGSTGNCFHNQPYLAACMHMLRSTGAKRRLFRRDDLDLELKNLKSLSALGVLSERSLPAT